MAESISAIQVRLGVTFAVASEIHEQTARADLAEKELAEVRAERDAAIQDRDFFKGESAAKGILPTRFEVDTFPALLAANERLRKDLDEARKELEKERKCFEDAADGSLAYHFKLEAAEKELAERDEVWQRMLAGGGILFLNRSPEECRAILDEATRLVNEIVDLHVKERDEARKEAAEAKASVGELVEALRHSVCVTCQTSANPGSASACQSTWHLGIANLPAAVRQQIAVEEAKDGVVEAARDVFDESGDPTDEANLWANLQDALAKLDAAKRRKT